MIDSFRSAPPHLRSLVLHVSSGFLIMFVIIGVLMVDAANAATPKFCSAQATQQRQGPIGQYVGSQVSPNLRTSTVRGCINGRFPEGPATVTGKVGITVKRPPASAFDSNTSLSEIAGTDGQPLVFTNGYNGTGKAFFFTHVDRSFPKLKPGDCVQVSLSFTWQLPDVGPLYQKLKTPPGCVR